MELRIKEVCKAKRISLQYVADELGITRQSLSVSIRNNPSTKRLQEIADILNVSVFELIKTDGNCYHSYTEKGQWIGVFNRQNLL